MLFSSNSIGWDQKNMVGTGPWTLFWDSQRSTTFQMTTT